MEVKIDEILSDNEVIISNKYGVAKAKWIGELPEENSNKHIEVEIKNTLEWGVDILKSEEKMYNLGTEEGSFFLIGCLESYETDGYTVVRCGESIIFLDTIGKPFFKKEYIKVTAQNVEFYDIRI
ncbi:hypothetical protein [Vallitalea okinawensis]|uniref:hypothetical protein n=1 Tax=Vallitalea okinawensis TaxID=2078660 RepID=UPI000CFD9269|nr:hypothetical protein [Vallitalea okinawensis]